MAERRGTLSGKMATDMNHDLFKAEKEEILRQERKTIEENKILKTDHARLDRELDAEKKKVAGLRNELENAERTAIANFKSTDDFQTVFMPVFLEGFAHAKVKFSAAFPDLDISKIEAGSSSTATEGHNKEVEGGEEHSAVEEVAEGAQQDKDVARDANIQAENVDGASTTANIGDKDSTAQNVD